MLFIPPCMEEGSIHDGVERGLDMLDVDSAAYDEGVIGLAQPKSAEH